MDVSSSTKRAHRLMLLGTVAGAITGSAEFLWSLFRHRVNHKVGVLWTLAGGLMEVVFFAIAGLFVGGLLAVLVRRNRTIDSSEGRHRRRNCHR